MDLSFGPEYEDFRAELRSFIEKNKHKAPPPGMGMHHPGPQERDWQKLLIEHGYTCRTIPKEYGGYGGEADILKTVIIQDEFAKANVNSGLSGQGIGMLVPTLLENGNEEQREKFIREHLRWVWQAIHDGADVRGYLYWSLLDNFEWARGFKPRFGLVEVDYATLQRKIRSSALEYAKICKDNLP